MVDPLGWCASLEQTRMAMEIRESVWIFPAIETVHLIGIVLLVGSTSILDLRLLGLALRGSSIEKLTRRLLPWTWLGFATQVVTGFFLFSSEATTVYLNRPFRIKMSLIALAGVNALVFHVTTNRSAVKWENDAAMPLGATIAGLSSVLLWLGVVIAGRWIAYS